MEDPNEGEFEGVFRKREEEEEEIDISAIENKTPVKRSEGWLDNKKIKKSRIEEESSAREDIEELEKINVSYNIEQQASPAVMQKIETLKDKEREELIKKVADAPQQEQTKIKSLNELARNTFDLNRIKKEVGVDLSMLFDELVPESQALTVDEEWTEEVFFKIMNKEDEAERKRRLEERRKKFENDKILINRQGGVKRNAVRTKKRETFGLKNVN